MPRAAWSSRIRAASSEPGFADRLGGRLVGSGRGLIASFGLGAIFAIGWTPCIGIILGGILTLAATLQLGAQGGILLVAYTLGLGIPFLAIGLVYDRAPAILRPLARHGRAVSVIGGLLVAAIGVAMLFDLLLADAALLPVPDGGLMTRRAARVRAPAAERHGLIGPFSGAPARRRCSGSSSPWPSSSSRRPGRSGRTGGVGPGDPRADGLPPRLADDRA